MLSSVLELLPNFKSTYFASMNPPIMSSLITPIISLPIRRLRTSPTPIGLTPGLPSFVSPSPSGINLHAISSVKQSGFTSSEHDIFATSAIAWHSCNEAFPNAFEQRKS